MGSYFFELPKDPEAIAGLIEAVPANWSWVDGYLEADKGFLLSGHVVAGTGFRLSRFHTIHPTIIGEYDPEKRAERDPDLAAIMIDRRLPGFVSFDEAGFEDRRITLALAIRVAAHFARIGYGVHYLAFFKDHHDNSKYSNSATCTLRHDRREGWPARLELEWNEKFGGTETSLEPILSVCRSLGLQPVVRELASKT